VYEPGYRACLSHLAKVGVAGSNPVVRSRRTAGQGRWKPAFLLARNRRKCQGSRRGPVSYTTSSRIRRPGRPFDYRPPRGSAGGPCTSSCRAPLAADRRAQRQERATSGCQSVSRGFLFGAHRRTTCTRHRWRSRERAAGSVDGRATPPGAHLRRAARRTPHFTTDPLPVLIEHTNRTGVPPHPRDRYRGRSSPDLRRSAARRSCVLGTRVLRPQSRSSPQVMGRRSWIAGTVSEVRRSPSRGRKQHRFPLEPTESILGAWMALEMTCRRRWASRRAVLDPRRTPAETRTSTRS
jgi:hypothetical protein